MTGIAFLLVCVAVGYVGYWMIINDRLDPDGARKGWLATKEPKPPTEERRQKGPSS